MNKVIIKGAKYIETKREVELPAFFKDKRHEHYVGIISATNSITVSNYDFSRSVSYSKSFNLDIEEEKYKQITAEAFYMAYNKCLQDITKEVATATAYDEQ